MVLMLLEHAPTSLRGELSRWLMELKAGVFLGTASALVREELWALCTTRIGAKGGCLLVYPAQTEQGFRVQVHGILTRSPVEFEGIWLLRRAISQGRSGGGLDASGSEEDQ